AVGWSMLLEPGRPVLDQNELHETTRRRLGQGRRAANELGSPQSIVHFSPSVCHAPERSHAPLAPTILNPLEGGLRNSGAPVVRGAQSLLAPGAWNGRAGCLELSHRRAPSLRS